jgi:hypothetical protein
MMKLPKRYATPKIFPPGRGAGLHQCILGLALVEGVVGAVPASGGGIKLEVLIRRTRKITFRIGSVLDHIAGESPLPAITVEVQPAIPRAFQHPQVPPRSTVTRGDTLQIAELPYILDTGTNFNKRILV